MKIEGKILHRCKECGELKEIGKKTKQCLECLDWKMGDLQK